MLGQRAAIDQVHTYDTMLGQRAAIDQVHTEGGVSEVHTIQKGVCQRYIHTIQKGVGWKRGGR